MIKGIQRKMVLVRTPESKIFEEAHLVLRAENSAGEPEEGDMLREANRIIESAGLATEERRPARKRGRGRFLSFLGGGLFGGGVASAVWAIVCFL